MNTEKHISNNTFLEVRKELKNYQKKICDSKNVSEKLMYEIELKHLEELYEIKKKHIKEIETFIRDYEINYFVMDNCDRITRTIINGMENNKSQIIAKVKFAIPKLLNFYIDINYEDVIQKILDSNPFFTNVRFKILKIMPFDRLIANTRDNYYMYGVSYHSLYYRHRKCEIPVIDSIYTPKIDFCNCMVKVLFEW